eukprot:COSAG05_NODE_323_length_11408_cov_361.826156_17_plen_200_part_00
MYTVYVGQQSGFTVKRRRSSSYRILGTAAAAARAAAVVGAFEVRGRHVVSQEYIEGILPETVDEVVLDVPEGAVESQRRCEMGNNKIYKKKKKKKGVRERLNQRTHRRQLINKSLTAPRSVRRPERVKSVFSATVPADTGAVRPSDHKSRVHTGNLQSKRTGMSLVRVGISQITSESMHFPVQTTGNVVRRRVYRSSAG